MNAKTRTEKILHGGAEHHLPGSGDALVTILRCATGLRMAATINRFLLDPDTREATLVDMRGQVKKPSRKGAKLDRYVAAVEALDELTSLALPYAPHTPVRFEFIRSPGEGPEVLETDLVEYIAQARDEWLLEQVRASSCFTIGKGAQ